MCSCFIIPQDVLDRLASDKKLSANARQAAAATSRLSVEIRKLRTQAQALTSVSNAMGAHFVELATTPKILVYDCRHTQTLPGTPATGPAKSKDKTVKRAFTETTQVAKFYKEAFGRNSIDNAGMTLLSSIHFGVDFNNAQWTGTQMLYGDGDGEIFIDFTNGNDVIGHELTHGVTQYTLQLAYSGDAGGLNESLSDCFGSMFRQWEAGQDVAAADWLIGADIMGSAAKTKGFKCLRNMANPADTHALAPQPTMYSQITPGMDPHYSSGPPNLAFSVACKTLGGKSWEQIGKVWYGAMTGFGPNPSMKMPEFAGRTRQVATQMFAADPKVVQAVNAGWTTVGL
jgi:Zn-dependent metalloprotease